MTAEAVSKWARRHVAVGAVSLAVWGGLVVAGAGRRPEVAVGLFGVVLHTLFGKAYSLVPSYFDRTLAVERAPAVQFPLTAAGAVGLVLAAFPGAPTTLGAVAGVLWAAGVAVFLGAIVWTIRDNLSGRATATSEANADRRGVDRLANVFVPVALVYLAVGSYEVAAVHAGLPALLGSPAAASHLLAAGTAALLVFAVGFRLLPRFLVASPPRPLMGVVLSAGAVGPVLVAASLGGGPVFRLGAALEATAVVGFAAAFVVLFVRSDRDRVGFYGVLLGVLAGAVAAVLGLSFAFLGIDPGLVAAHYRLNLYGFLGLTIVGVSYQFYPPGVGRFMGAGDRTAMAAIGLLAAGVAVAAAGASLRVSAVVRTGGVIALAGALVHAYLVLGLFRQRYG